MIAKDCTERLSAVSGHEVRASSPSNALTEIAWEDAVQGLGMAMSTVASKKNREMLFIGNVFYKQ